LKKKYTVAGLAIIAGLLLTGGASACGSAEEPTSRDKQQENAAKKFDGRTAPDVTGDTEYDNYIKAQELYDDPATVLWCTSAFPSASSPVFTVPVSAKLTSSSVSFFPNQKLKYADGGEFDHQILVESQSVDGMYHGSPPPYRYGFTPGGQYVDFTGLSTFCTTQLTEFQRVSLDITTDADQALADQAEAQLDAQ
jgi:hypothetical protein